MDRELLWGRFPLLWHMAESGSWPSIRQFGLLSTTWLLDQYGVEGARRVAIESNRRAECVAITRGGLPGVVIRDNKPMSDGALRKCLQDDLEPTDWYRIVNARVFFWVSQSRLRRLLDAKAYRGRSQTILTLKTRTLVDTHGDCVELSPINSGSTIFNPVPRGLGTFQSIENYNYDYWKERRGRKDAVVELVVRGGVEDVAEHVLAVHEWDGGCLHELWRRPGIDAAIGP